MAKLERGNKIMLKVKRTLHSLRTDYVYEGEWKKYSGVVDLKELVERETEADR